MSEHICPDCHEATMPVTDSTVRVCGVCGNVYETAPASTPEPQASPEPPEPTDAYLMGRMIGESWVQRLASFFTGKSPEVLRAEIAARRTEKAPGPFVRPTAPADPAPTTTECGDAVRAHRYAPPVVATDLAPFVQALRDSIVGTAVRSGLTPNLTAEAIWTATMLATSDLRLPGGSPLWAAQALLASAGDDAAANVVLTMLIDRLRQGVDVPPEEAAAAHPTTKPVAMPRVVRGPAPVVPNMPLSRPRQPGEVLARPTTRARFRVIEGGKATPRGAAAPPTPPETEPTGGETA